jgi:hypothetical protein
MSTVEMLNFKHQNCNININSCFSPFGFLTFFNSTKKMCSEKLLGIVNSGKNDTCVIHKSNTSKN